MCPLEVGNRLMPVTPIGTRYTTDTRGLPNGDAALLVKSGTTDLALRYSVAADADLVER